VAQDRRKQLVHEFKQRPPAAGVYRIVNERTGKVLLGSAMNLASVRGKLEFARATNTPGALDHRLSKDVREYGLDAFRFEVLEVLEVGTGRTQAQAREDLEALEALWRERLSAEELY
jgi:hypothetical protein